MLKMSPKLTFAPGFTDATEAINVTRMREERAARVKQAMRQQGVPAVLVTHENNVRYLTGFVSGEWMPHLSYVLFFAEHEPVLFAVAGAYQQMPPEMPWIKHWRCARSWLSGICSAEAMREEGELFAREIREELEERGLAGEKLGIVGFDDVARESLRAAGLTVADAWPLLLEASKIKTQDEINCFKVAASICSSGFQRIIDACRIGMTASALRRTAMDAVTDAGAEIASCGVQSGPFTFEKAASAPDRRIEYGDMLNVSLCGNKYLGYPSCLYRCFIVGRKPTDTEKGWYDRVKNTLDACIEATKVGNTTGDAAKAFPPASSWGYKDESEVLMVEIGHGLGMPVQAPARVPYGMPVVNRQWSLRHPQPFEKGMIIAYESLEGVRRVGGCRLEDMVVVTDDGCEVLDHFPRDEIIPVCM